MYCNIIKRTMLIFILSVVVSMPLMAKSYDDENRVLQAEIGKNNVNNMEAIMGMILESIFKDCEEAVYHANQSSNYITYKEDIIAGLNEAKQDVKKKYEKEVRNGALSIENAQDIMKIEQGQKEEEFKKLEDRMKGKLNYKIGRLNVLVSRVHYNIKNPPTLGQANLTDNREFKRQKNRFLASKAMKEYRSNLSSGQIPNEIKAKMEELIKWLNYSDEPKDGPIIDPELVKRL